MDVVIFAATAVAMLIDPIVLAVLIGSAWMAKKIEYAIAAGATAGLGLQWLSVTLNGKRAFDFGIEQRLVGSVLFVLAVYGLKQLWTNRAKSRAVEVPGHTPMSPIAHPDESSLEFRYVASKGRLQNTGTAKGVGVFAECDIRAGEIVEIAPVIEFDCGFDDLPQNFQERVFNWNRLALRPGVVQALGLGYASMYNHANPANMVYSATESGESIVFAAASDIKKGEELTVNYNDTGGGAESSDDIWFRERGISLLS